MRWGTAIVVVTLVLAVPVIAAHDTDPGISPSFALFPGHDEVVASLSKHAAHPWVRLHTVGNSSEGRPIQVALVTDPSNATPMDQRVVTFIFTQQHGNEPAGTPAALQLLDNLTASSPLRKHLANQVLLLLPMANPDGATLERRGNADGVDINRDHIGLETPEAEALHAVLNRWDVHVAMDHHEYSGTGFGNPVPIRTYDYDITTMFPNHGNVRASTGEASRKLMYEGIWPAAEAAGFTANEYGEQTVAGVPVQQVAGGPDPGMMRNHLGLHHVAGLLVETRVDLHPNPFHDAQRRIDSHRLVMEATLRYVSENADYFRQRKAFSMDAVPEKEYVEGDARGAIAPYYTTEEDAKLILALGDHGVLVDFVGTGDIVYSAHFAFTGHFAALTHEKSSRAIVSVKSVPAPPPGPDMGPAETIPEARTPGPSLLLFGLCVGFAALAWDRRQRNR